LVGGGELIRQFISHQLIDEFRLFVHPIILGEGGPLFLRHSERTNLTFEGSQSFSSGLVELQYRLTKKDDTA
jgi:dihydrofolate reductase